MRSLGTSFIFVLIGVLLIGLGIQTGKDWMVVVAIPIMVAGASFTVMVSKRMRQKRTRSAEPDSVEAVLGTRTASASFVDVIVGTAVLGAASLFLELPAAWGLATLVLVIAVVSYWGRYAFLARRSLGRDPADE